MGQKGDIRSVRMHYKPASSLRGWPRTPHRHKDPDSITDDEPIIAATAIGQRFVVVFSIHIQFHPLCRSAFSERTEVQ